MTKVRMDMTVNLGLHDRPYAAGDVIRVIDAGENLEVVEAGPVMDGNTQALVIDREFPDEQEQP